MSVRREKRRDPKTGRRREFWMVDVDYCDATGKRRRVRRVSPVQTRRGAEQFERQVRQALMDGNVDGEAPAANKGRGKGKEEKEKVITLDQFLKEWLELYAANNNRRSEYEAKESIIRLHFVPFFGSVPLKRLGVKQVEQYKAAKLKEGFAPKSINNHLTVLRRALVSAVEFGHLEAVPPVRRLKTQPPVTDFLDFDEADRLLQSTPDKWRALVATALLAGLRRGELLALRWIDVDLVQQRIWIRRSRYRDTEGPPKSGKHREVPMCLRLAEALKEHRRGPSGYVFCSAEGKPLPRQRLWRILNGICTKAGLRHVQWHTLRHSFASHLAMKGVPLRAIQELMGHSTIEMTMRYAHLAPATLREAVSVLDSVAVAATATGDTATAT